MKSCSKYNLAFLARHFTIDKKNLNYALSKVISFENKEVLCALIFCLNIGSDTEK